MDIRKQESHSVFSKIFQVKGENYLALTVMSAFPFDRSPELLDETELWNAAGSAMSNHDVLDMFIPKQKGEVLAAGKFFSPGGRAVRAGLVRISIGSVDKTLHVFGDRHWIKKAGLVRGISDPQPMTEMEITYMNAFGGTGYKQNPLGKGMKEQGPEGTIPLPHIEYPHQLIGSWSDRPKPAGFGPGSKGPKSLALTTGNGWRPGGRGSRRIWTGRISMPHPKTSRLRDISPGMNKLS
jgi:hypothetical protein